MPRTTTNKTTKKSTSPATSEPPTAPEAPRRGPGRPPKAKSFPLSVYSCDREAVLDFPDEASRSGAINQISKRCPRGLDARITVGEDTYHFVRVDYMKY
jgi:hypothetical protein